MKPLGNHAPLLCLLCIAATGLAQLRNPNASANQNEDSNVVSRTERLDRDTNRTNVYTKIKTYRDGVLLKDYNELDKGKDGLIDVKGTRIYQSGEVVLMESWDAKSKTTTRTFSQAGRAVVSEIDTNSDGIADWILFHDKDELVSFAVQRLPDGKLQPADRATISEMQRGSQLGSKFMDHLLDGIRK